MKFLFCVLLIFFAGLIQLTATEKENETFNYEELCFSPPDGIVIESEFVVFNEPAKKTDSYKIFIASKKEKTILNREIFLNRPGEGCSNKYLIKRIVNFYTQIPDYLNSNKSYAAIGYSMSDRWS